MVNKDEYIIREVIPRCWLSKVLRLITNNLATPHNHWHPTFPSLAHSRAVKMFLNMSKFLALT